MNGQAESQVRGDGVPAALFVTVIILALAVLGMPFASAWSGSPDLGHGWALPWLTSWLLWERRAVVVATQTGRPPWYAWAGLGVLGGAALFLLLLLGPYPLLPTALWGLGLVFTALALGAAGVVGGAGAVRTLAVPVMLVLLGLPWPTLVENTVVLPLRGLLASITVEVLNIAGVPSLADGTVIHIPGGTVGVDEACGGMRSLQASILIAFFVGEAGLLAWRRRLVLLGAAVAAAVTGNLLRVGVLTVGAHTGGEARLHAWHDPAGYLALFLTLAVVGGLGWCWGGRETILIPTSGGNWARAPRISGVKLAWAVSALAIMASAGLFVRHWYGARSEALASQPGWRVSWPLRAEDFHEDPLGPAGQESLRADEYAAASWKAEDGSDRSAYFIEWRTGQKARFLPLMHNPEICLSMLGSRLLGRFGPTPVRVGRLVLPFSGYEFLREGRTTYVFSILWDMDEERAFVPPPAADGWLETFRVRWADVEARRARVRVEVCTYEVTGAKGRKDAEDKFRREMEGGFLAQTAHR